jgi:hypothetical protein
MNKTEPDFSFYPGLDTIFAESCKTLLDNIAEQIIADQKIDLGKLAITAYAENKHNVSVLVNACRYIAAEIGSHIGKNLEVYSINLSGYQRTLSKWSKPTSQENKLPSEEHLSLCEKHRLPWKDTLNLDFILFTDSFTDAILLRHAHYVVSKQGVDDQKIKIATVFYFPKIYRCLEFDSYSLQGRLLIPKSFSKEPDYVGQVLNF